MSKKVRSKMRSVVWRDCCLAVESSELSLLGKSSIYILFCCILFQSWTGEPPQTGTATLNIHVRDQNDNVPQPSVDRVDVCLSDSSTTTNITAFDLDENPFGGPFKFELQGDVERKWKLNPSYGRNSDALTV